MEAPASFHEEQRINRWFVALVVAAVALPPIGVFGYAAIEQLLFGRPVGDQPMSDTALAISAAAAIVVSLLIAVAVGMSRLVTEVRPSGLYVRYVPFHRRPRRIALDRVVRCRPVTYRPIRDYGGWGLRWVPGGFAYNVRGNRGVRIDYADGRHLLIGSQNPDELAAAIQPLVEGPAAGPGGGNPTGPTAGVAR